MAIGDSTKPYRSSFEARFWEKVERRGPDECWPWTACVNRLGRGQIWAYPGYPRKNMSAPRAAYIIAFGEFDFSLCVCHRCDNPTCVNPAHLFLGTNKDNTQDAKEKGRLRVRSGETHASAKLTVNAVREIRRRVSRGASDASLAPEFGVTAGAILAVRTRRTWKSVE